MRTSSYTIYVELPESPNEQLLIHGYSGAYDVVERRIADYLRANDDSRHTPLHGDWRDEPPVEAGTDIVLSDETLGMLKSRGFLTTQTAEQERAAVRRLAGKRHTVEVARQPNYVLMPTYQCNLRCAYCFQDHMRTRPELSHLLQTMTKDMGRRVIRAMDSIDARHPHAAGKPRNITLFGGEPFLAENRPFMEWLIRELRAASPCRIMAVSNATQLESHLDLFGPEGISFVQITIDGPPAVHDQRRIHADGSGSFAMIAANTKRVLDRGAQVGLRINVDRTNIGGLPELAREIIAHGWHERPGFRAYAAAVNAFNENIDKKDTYNGYALNMRMNELRAEYPELRVIGTPTDEMRGLVSRILRGEVQPWTAYKASFCGAHTSMYVIDSFGDIYACWERTGDPTLRIGSIGGDGVPRFVHAPPQTQVVAETKKLLPMVGKLQVTDIDMWRDRTIATNDTCASCRYAFYCGGGCASEAIDHRGAYYTNHCDGFQQRFRVAAAAAYEDIRQGRSSELAGTIGCGS